MSAGTSNIFVRTVAPGDTLTLPAPVLGGATGQSITIFFPANAGGVSLACQNLGSCTINGNIAGATLSFGVCPAAASYVQCYGINDAITSNGAVGNTYVCTRICDGVNTL